jgi:hypothetical protein
MNLFFLLFILFYDWEKVLFYFILYFSILLIFGWSAGGAVGFLSMQMKSDE